MKERMKEHDRDIRLARTQNSAVSEHANGTGHEPLWNEMKFEDFRYMKIHIFALRWKDEIRRSSQLRTLLKRVVVSRT